MYCKNCGKEIEDAAYSCMYCGTKTDSETAYTRAQRQQEPSRESADSSLGVAALICSFFIPLIGLILGIMGIKRYGNGVNPSGKSLSLAGVIVSVIAMVLTFLIIVIITVVILNDSMVYYY